MLHNVKLEATLEDNSGFLNLPDGNKIDPGYSPKELAKEGIEWAIIFNCCDYWGFETTDQLVKDFSDGLFDIYTY